MATSVIRTDTTLTETLLLTPTDITTTARGLLMPSPDMATTAMGDTAEDTTEDTMVATED